MGSKKLAIIGCGAKALAIGAKADALAAAGCPVSPSVEIFERADAAGALWAADNSGYSDGSPAICTSFMRDLGYPYPHFFHPEVTGGTASELTNIRTNVLNDNQWRTWDSEIWPGVSEYIFSKYSTTAWLHRGASSSVNDQNLHLPSELTFKRWVDEGVRQLTHQEFARYLRWVATGLSHSPVVNIRYGCEVSHLDREKKDATYVGWDVTAKGGISLGKFDGLIISGNGTVRTPDGYVAPTTEISERCLDMKEFWKPRSQKQVELLLEEDHAKIVRKLESHASGGGFETSAPRSEPETVRAVIAGAGGAATAVAARILRMTVPVSITILGSPAALYSRHSNPFEEQYYGSNTLWEPLHLKKKIEFLRRLGASASWSEQIGELAASGRVDYRSAYWLGWEANSGLVEPQLRFAGGIRPARALFHLGVNATGYDTFGYIASFFDHSPDVKSAIVSAGNNLSINAEPIPNEIEDLASASFELRPSNGDGRRMLRGLHLPDLCSIKGPASANLMALGWVADSILKDYISNVKK
jgi:hypothetical protein